MEEFEIMKNYILREPRMKPFLEQVIDEYKKDDYPDLTDILKLTIGKLLDDYEIKCEQLKYAECFITKFR